MVNRALCEIFSARENCRIRNGDDYLDPGANLKIAAVSRCWGVVSRKNHQTGFDRIDRDRVLRLRCFSPNREKMGADTKDSIPSKEDIRIDRSLRYCSCEQGCMNMILSKRPYLRILIFLRYSTEAIQILSINSSRAEIGINSNIGLLNQYIRKLLLCFTDFKHSYQRKEGCQTEN